MKTVKIEIKSVIGKLLFEFEKENNTIKDTLIEANLRGANLHGADLYGADLRGANLYGADLREANLRVANLYGANLRGANLRVANLYGANLREANLYGADLREANLYGADLYGANLRGANLYGADLREANLRVANLYGANLRGANLTLIKADLYLILLNAKHEVQGLKDALLNGIVDGSTYIGECACLVGTLANVKHTQYDKLPGITPDASRPAEKWFTNIKKGDKPENNAISKITVEWINEFLELIK